MSLIQYLTASSSSQIQYIREYDDSDDDVSQPLALDHLRRSQAEHDDNSDNEYRAKAQISEQSSIIAQSSHQNSVQSRDVEDDLASDEEQDEFDDDDDLQELEGDANAIHTAIQQSVSVH